MAASKSVRSLLNVLKEGEGEIVQQAPAIAGDICSLLNRTLAKRNLGDELVFSRIAVLDKDGDLILDSDSECLLNADDL